MKAKVLFVVEQLEDSRYYSDLFHWLESESYEIWFFNLAQFKFNEATLAHRTILNTSSNYFMSMIQLMRLMHRFDVIHAHEFIPAFYSVIAKLVSFNQKKLIFHWHHGKSKGFKPFIMASFSMFFSDRIVFVSEEMRAINVGRKKIRNGKFKVIENGISVDPSPVDISRDIDICLLGRLREEKGFLQALEAIAEIRQIHPQLKVKLIGSGPQKEELKNKIAKLHLSDAVEMLGHIYNPIPFLHRSKILLVPSRSEPFGIVAIEGLGAGAVVVASRVGGLMHIIDHNKNGLLVGSNDLVGFSNSIHELLINHALRTKLSEAGLEKFNLKYSAAKMAERYTLLYKELLNGS